MAYKKPTTEPKKEEIKEDVIDEAKAQPEPEEVKEETVADAATAPSEEPEFVGIKKKGYSGKGDIAIIKNDNQYIRTYSEKNHGKGFKKLAETFTSKDKAYSMVDDGAINKLMVVYKAANKFGIIIPMKKEFGGDDKEAAIRLCNEHSGQMLI